MVGVDQVKRRAAERLGEAERWLQEASRDLSNVTDPQSWEADWARIVYCAARVEMGIAQAQALEALQADASSP